MYGVAGKIVTQEGRQEELINVLLKGLVGLPGCLSYLVAKDTADENGIWITEVWDSRESHTVSLSLPSVRAAIAQGRGLIHSFGERFETVPVGGHGLVAHDRR